MKRNSTNGRGKAAPVIAGAAALILALAGCGGVKTVPLTKLAAYLAKLPANTDTTPATVGIAKANISAEWGAINSVVAKGGRYVILDLSSCIANGNTIEGALPDHSSSGSAMNIISDNELIKGIILPATLTGIGLGAFNSCSGLTSITIPSGVTSIGAVAFYLCSGLTSITIPGSVTSIGEAAFAGCDNLTSVTFAPGSAITECYDNSFGYGNDNLVEAYQAGGAGTYTRTGDNWTKQ